MRLFSAGLSLGVCVAVSAVYALRPANVDPVTIWPFWFWSVPGVGLGLLGLSRRTWRWALVAVLAWMAATGWIAEEPRCLLRSWRSSQRVDAERRGLLRVVTLNCGGGSIEAVRDAAAQDADIILLQEMPGRDGLAEVLERRSGWAFATGMDPAIMALGHVRDRSLPPHKSHFMCEARVVPARLNPPTEILALSTRLALPQLRFDLWRPGVWREASKVRAIRAEQMARLLEHVSAAAPAPVIVGGDFNTPAGDSLFRPLRPHLRDAFAEAGMGWPNTITDEHPMARIDQIWVSEHFEVHQARVVYTPNSDHRMLVVDLALD